MQELLRKIEWNGRIVGAAGASWRCCPMCEHRERDGHNQDCEIGKAINGARVVCSACDGTGYEDCPYVGRPDHDERCNVCDGNGTLGLCQVCGGYGYTIDGGES